MSAPVLPDVPVIDQVTARAPVRAYLAGFVFVGLGIGFGGPALSYLRDRVGTDDAGIAFVFVGQAAGYIVGSLAAARGLDRGRGHQWWTSAMVVATMSVGLIAVLTDLVALVAAFVVLGAACGLADVCGNTLVVWSRPGDAGSTLNALHLSFALGALSTPLLVNRSLAWFDSLWLVVLPMAIITVVCGVAFLRTRAPARTRVPAVRRADSTHAPRAWQIGVVCLFFFAYVAVEAGFAGWIHTYVEQIGYGGAGTATGVTVMFWAGFTAGRILAVGLSRRVSPGWLVASSTALSIVAALLFWWFPGPSPTLWLVTFLFAVSLAPQYASMMGFAEGRLVLSGRSTSAFVASSGLGGLIVPLLIGVMFVKWGPGSLPPTIVVAAVVAGAAGVLAGHLLAGGQRPPETSSTDPVT